MAPSIQAAAAKNIDDEGADAPLAANEDEMMNPKAGGEEKWYQSKTCLVHPLLILVQFIFSGYHVLTSSALKTKGVDPLVFALYRELSASILIALYAYWAIFKGGHKYVITIERELVCVYVCICLHLYSNSLSHHRPIHLHPPTHTQQLAPRQGTRPALPPDGPLLRG